MERIHREDLSAESKLFNEGAQRFGFTTFTVFKRFHSVNHATSMTKGTDDGNKILKPCGNILVALFPNGENYAGLISDTQVGLGIPFLLAVPESPP